MEVVQAVVAAPQPVLRRGGGPARNSGSSLGRCLRSTLMLRIVRTLFLVTLCVADNFLLFGPQKHVDVVANYIIFVLPGRRKKVL